MPVVRCQDTNNWGRQRYLTPYSKSFEATPTSSLHVLILRVVHLNYHGSSPSNTISIADARNSEDSSSSHVVPKLLCLPSKCSHFISLNWNNSLHPLWFILLIISQGPKQIRGIILAEQPLSRSNQVTKKSTNYQWVYPCTQNHSMKFYVICQRSIIFRDFHQQTIWHCRLHYTWVNGTLLTSKASCNIKWYIFRDIQ